MKKFLKILKHLAPYKKEVFLNIFFNLLGVFFGLFSITMTIPFLSILFGTIEAPEHVEEFTLSAKSLMDQFYYILHGIMQEYDKIGGLVFICILVIVLFFFKNLLVYCANFYLAPLRHNVVRDLRNLLFRKIIDLPLSFFSNKKRGDIIARMSGDVQEVEWSILTSLEMIFRNPITIILYFSVLLFMSFKLTLFVLVLLPISGFVIGRLGKSLRKSSKIGQSKIGGLLSVIEEVLAGNRIIKAFNAEEMIKSRFLHMNNAYTKVMVKIFRKRYLASPLSEFLGIVVMVVVMWFGGSIVLDSLGQPNPEITPEGFIGYLVIFSQILSPAKSFSTAYFNVQKGMASIDRINEILNAEITIQEKPDAKSILIFSDSIEYIDASFQYEDEPVLKNINLKIEHGKTIALVGQSGAGKTTLVDLLPRFFDLTGGDILIDGISIKDLKIKDLRSLMGIVTQESILFNDTFFNNIAFGTNETDIEKIQAAAKVANAHDFIMESPNGYHFNIGDKGGKLSGGQRQRVSIARAVLKNPPILILDEATSSLDTESERLVQDALFNLMKDRTSLVIAHRLSTIQHADEIIVMHEGVIAERGSHDDLLANSVIYKKLHEMQMFS